MSQKVFITGISGFVGAGLARYLLELGYEVHGMVRTTSNLWRLLDIKNSIHLHEGDLLDDRSVTDTLNVVRPDVIFHFGVYGAYSTQKDADIILSTSILSTMHLLRSAKEVGVKMFVNAGSSSEYGTKDHPMREDERIDPNSYYAVGKSAQTHLCQHFARTEKFPVVTLRFFSVYGPFEEPGRLVPSVILNAFEDKDISLADRKIARDFIYLDDVIKACVLASQKPELSGEVFNLGTGVQHTLGELADVVIAHTGTQSKVVTGAYEQRSFDTHIWVADMQKTASLLGFTATDSFDNGVKKSIDWYKQHADLYKK